MTQFHLKPRTTRQPQDTIDGHTRPSTRLVDGHTRLVTIDWRLSCASGLNLPRTLHIAGLIRVLGT